MKLTFKKPTFNFRVIKTLPLLLASHAFLIMISLILISLLAGGASWWQYVVQATSAEQEMVEKNTAFRYTTYGKILNYWQVKTKELTDSKDASYTNPFINTSQNVTPKKQEIIETNDQ